MRNTQSERYIGMGINILRRRGKGGQYHPEGFCRPSHSLKPYGVGGNHYWHTKLAATLWSMNGFWGSAWFACWGRCIAALLPDLTRRVDAHPGVVALDKITIKEVNNASAGI